MKMVKFFIIVVGALFSLVGLTASQVLAFPLEIKTQSLVDAKGKVTVTLKMRNISGQSLMHLHPMFHFHHTMASLPMVHQLEPEEAITLVSHDHPPVRTRGSYPLVAMIGYREAGADVTQTQLHTDSFYFKEPLASEVQGSMVATMNEESSLLTVALKNVTPSFKNLRLMLVLPPELKSDQFQSMKGFTLRGGEEKTIQIPVQKISGLPGGEFPVHLLVEYGQMLNHYSGDIAGQVSFGPLWGEGPLWPHLLIWVFVLAGFYRFMRLRPLKTSSV